MYTPVDSPYVSHADGLAIHTAYIEKVRAYSQHKFRTAATTLLAAVLDRYATDPLSSGATFWNPGVTAEIAAKKRRKNEQKWARYGRLKRVRAALLRLRNT